MKKNITILDGGMGREIKNRLSNWDDTLWSASGLINAPNIVKDIHRDFILAGSDIITTNNYTVVPSILEPNNVINQFQNLVELAGKIANEAKIDVGKKSVQIAGSIPPLKSTYRPDLVPDEDTVKSTYSKIANWLDPYIDFFLCESFSTIKEAVWTLELLSTYNKPVWVSFILDDHRPSTLLSGESVDSILSQLPVIHYDALLFNCCAPTTILNAFSMIKTIDKPFGGYANAFTPIHKKGDTWNHDHSKQLRSINEEFLIDDYIKTIHKWIDQGASIIGGCCGIGPDYIANIKGSIKTLNS